MKCVKKTIKLVRENGVKVFESLDDLATYLNGLTIYISEDLNGSK